MIMYVYCFHYAAFNAYLFPLSELVEQSLRGDDIVCLVHKEPVPLKLLVSIVVLLLQPSEQK